MILEVNKIGVVGAGVMGSQIADIMAFNGKDVILVDISDELVKKGVKQIREFLSNLAFYQSSRAEREISRITKEDNVQLTEDQKIRIKEMLKPTFTEPQINETITRIVGTTNFQKLEDCDLVIEAVIENIEEKGKVMKQLDAVCSKAKVLATNTSTFSITELSSFTKNPGRVMGLHFFNPPVTLPLVEVIPGLETDEDTVHDTVEFLTTLRNHRRNLQPIKVKEVPGFLVNRVLMSMMTEAFSLYEQGVATIEEIDLAMKSGGGMPMGPFELADLIGIDVLYHISNSIRFMEGGNITPRPVQVIRKMFFAGRLGKKTGKGFYSYT